MKLFFFSFVVAMATASRLGSNSKEALGADLTDPYPWMVGEVMGYRASDKCMQTCQLGELDCFGELEGCAAMVLSELAASLQAPGADSLLEDPLSPRDGAGLGYDMNNHCRECQLGIQGCLGGLKACFMTVLTGVLEEFKIDANVGAGKGYDMNNDCKTCQTGTQGCLGTNAACQKALLDADALVEIFPGTKDGTSKCTDTPDFDEYPTGAGCGHPPADNCC